MTMDFALFPVLAQNAPPLPTEGMPAPGGTTGANGSSSGGAAQPSPFGGELMILFVLAVSVIIIFSLMGQRRERKKREAMLSAVRKHDRVQTIGGVIGSVVDVTPAQIVLKVDESSNTRITFARSAIQQVLSGGSDGAPSDESKG
jgi:preprotein translocase subunit YajC